MIQFLHSNAIDGPLAVFATRTRRLQITHASKGGDLGEMMAQIIQVEGNFEPWFITPFRTFFQVANKLGLRIGRLGGIVYASESIHIIGKRHHAI